MNDNQKGIYYLYKYRKLFIAALLIGGLSGLGISFVLPKKYMSTAIVYPYNSHTQDQLISNPQFGFEIETEQLLQLLSSKTMRDKTIEEFKLYDYYDLDTTSSSWNAELTLKYVNDIHFMRSKYLSVVINVTMEDPKLAADIANYQVEEVNRYRKEIFESNRKAYFEHVKTEFEKSEKELVALRDSIYGIKGGSHDLLFNFIENLNNENYDASEFVNDPKLETVVIDYRFAHQRNSELRAKFDQVQRDYDKPIPSVYAIDKAMPSFKKVSPSKVVNTLLGAIVFFTVVFTTRYLLDKLKQVKSTFSE